MTTAPSDRTASPVPMPAALEGVRVLDLGSPLGLYGTKLLADLGADVLLVEPPAGLPARSLPPFYHDEPGAEHSLAFWYLSTSKRSVTCNLDTQDGRALFARLVAAAQIVVAEGPPDRLEAHGVGYRRFAAAQPSLVWCSVSGFGDWGPHAGWLAPDLVGVAMSGIMTLAGFPDRAPVMPPGSQGYVSASVQAVQGILFALRVAERTGRGQQVEVSMQEALSLAQETSMQTWDMRQEVRKRSGAAGILPGVNTYASADGHVYSMVGVPGFGAPWSVLAAWMDEHGMADDLMEPQWQSLLGNINLRELTLLWSDPEKLAGIQVKFQHVNEVLTRFYASFPKQYLYEEGQKRRLLIGPVNSAKDLMENAQLRGRNWFQSVDHPELDTTVEYPGPPFRLGRTPWRISRRPPLIGEHNLEIWEDELGYRREQIEALTSAGVL